MMQQNLFDAPPVVSVAPSLSAVERVRLSAQCQKVLERLQQGPVTNIQLALIGYRYGARIHELRKAGYEIVMSSRNVETGETTYELRGQA